MFEGYDQSKFASETSSSSARFGTEAPGEMGRVTRTKECDGTQNLRQRWIIFGEFVVSLSLTQISGMELTIDFMAHPTRFERVTFAFGVLRLAACQHRRAPDLDYLGARQLVTDP